VLVGRDAELAVLDTLAEQAGDTEALGPALIARQFTLRGPGRAHPGRTIPHWWRFRGDKICFYRGTEDTARTADLLSQD
jgi:hypothetical protein